MIIERISNRIFYRLYRIYSFYRIYRIYSFYRIYRHYRHYSLYPRFFNNRLYDTFLNIFSISYFFSLLIYVTEVYALIKNHGIKLREWFVNQLLHHAVWGKRHLTPSRDQDTLTSSNIDTLAIFHINDLESTKALDLHQAIFLQTFIYQVDEGIGECLCLIDTDAILRGKHLGYIV